MEDEITGLKSLVEQIIDEMLEKIEKQEEFDAITFTNIKEIAKNGDLKNVTKVIEAFRCQDEIN
ncbi:MAG: hypothetical protein PQ975_00940 [Methanobacterium sp.]|jgi:hypothetical protein